MKILLTCDPEIPVPPLKYGGIERIIAGLAKSYSELGHQVFLVAHKDSKCACVTSVFGWPCGNSKGAINVVRNAFFLKKVVNEVSPDIVHSFSRLLYLYPIIVCRDAKIIQSYQRKISKYSTSVASLLAGNNLEFTSCSKQMINEYCHSNFRAIYNFTDCDFFVPIQDSDYEYLLFLGRIEDIKGTFEAIIVSKLSGYKLIIAGNVPENQIHYFENQVLPYIDNDHIQYVGEVDDFQKRHFLQNAKALLFPIKWEEPFGIVMAESLACGTPVIAFNRGSVPEVICHGISGYVVGSIDEMIESVNLLGTINRQDCRHAAISRFDSKLIAQEYLRIF